MIGYPEVKPHDLRHGVAIKEVLEQRHDLEQVRALLGHGRIGTTPSWTASIRAAQLKRVVGFCEEKASPSPFATAAELIAHGLAQGPGPVHFSRPQARALILAARPNPCPARSPTPLPSMVSGCRALRNPEMAWAKAIPSGH